MDSTLISHAALCARALFLHRAPLISVEVPQRDHVLVVNLSAPVLARSTAVVATTGLLVAMGLYGWLILATGL